MKHLLSLHTLDWMLTGCHPMGWSAGTSMETGAPVLPDVGAVPATVPGSVQAALRRAGLLPDWNLGMAARQCEWVENRSWIFSTTLPAAMLRGGRTAAILRLDGLDGEGRVLVNGRLAGAFSNAFIPHRFDLAPFLTADADARLDIVFEPPPRWLGQICRTSQIRDWKPRFNYGWDWTSRVVQIGIWDDAVLELTDGAALDDVRCETAVENGRGVVAVAGTAVGATRGVTVSLAERGSGRRVAERTCTAAELAAGIRLDGLDVDLWWPNGLGAQPLYDVAVELPADDGTVADAVRRTVGFRTVAWQPCAGAPAAADPWICTVNGRPVFLQGVNWTPVRPNFADVPEAGWKRRLDIYKDMGCNILRVWGGAVLETGAFYDACDERGLMLWQEFPLSSSGLDNWPPEDPQVIDEIAGIAASYVGRRRHHPALILWCGGNELQGGLDGSKAGTGKPVDAAHPLIARLADTVRRLDPARRFLPTSSSGPRFFAEERDYGRGLHWDIHGPWKLAGGTLEAHRRYWSHDDALFRSEAGCPGASSADLILRYAGDAASPFPASLENPLWSRTSWWFDWPEFARENGRDPRTLEEYVEWSQRRQAEGLAIAARACKERFPKCGGFIVWMGHDSFPCTCNTSVIDFEGNPKPAALALRDVFRS